MTPRHVVLPSRWLQGFLRARPTATVADAVAWWLDQERMEREHQAQAVYGEEFQR